MKRFTSLEIICVTVTLLLYVTQGIHGKPTNLLPNPVVSPHIKNQTLKSCGPPDPSLSLEITPKYISLGHEKLIKVKLTITPHVDIMSLACYGAIYMDGIRLVARSELEVCRKLNIKCPMKKNERQVFERDDIQLPLRYVSKGSYTFKGYCENENGVEVLCATWALTWV